MRRLPIGDLQNGRGTLAHIRARVMVAGLGQLLALGVSQLQLPKASYLVLLCYRDSSSYHYLVCSSKLIGAFLRGMGVSAVTNAMARGPAGEAAKNAKRGAKNAHGEGMASSTDRVRAFRPSFQRGADGSHSSPPSPGRFRVTRWRWQASALWA